MSTLQTNTIVNSAGKTLLNNGYPAQPGQVIEYLTNPCDGNPMNSYYGYVGTTGVYSYQYLGTGIVPVNGSSVTYKPPPGTSRVIYRFDFGSFWTATAQSITHFYFYIDGVEVPYARHNRSMQYLEYRSTFEWIIPIGGTANYLNGRQADWTYFKNMQMYAMRYGGGAANGQDLDGTQYWDGTTGNQFNQPQITLIAIA